MDSLNGTIEWTVHPSSKLRLNEKPALMFDKSKGRSYIKADKNVNHLLKVGDYLAFPQFFASKNKNGKYEGPMFEITMF